jgi:ABC-2 type transport system ATP-binding protein
MPVKLKQSRLSIPFVHSSDFLWVDILLHYFYLMLRLHNIEKFYDRKLALAIPQLELANDIYWVKGPNGSGKTTLLKMVAGLLPFDGNIELNNVSLKRQPVAYRRTVSWADAEPLFPAHMTGLEVAELYRAIRTSSKKEMHTLFDSFVMDNYIRNKIGTYSSGMTKKLSLVLALMGNVSLVILDESLITLDNEAMHMISTLINERHSSNGTSFLLSSHVDPENTVVPLSSQLLVKDQHVSTI